MPLKMDIIISNFKKNNPVIMNIYLFDFSPKGKSILFCVACYLTFDGPKLLTEEKMFVNNNIGFIDDLSQIVIQRETINFENYIYGMMGNDNLSQQAEQQKVSEVRLACVV